MKTTTLKQKTFPLASKTRGAAPDPTVWANGTARERLGDASGLVLSTFAADGVTFTSEGADGERARVRITKGKQTLGFISLLVSNGSSTDALLMRRYSMADVLELTTEEKQAQEVFNVFAGFKKSVAKGWEFMPEESKAKYLNAQWGAVEKKTLLHANESGTAMIEFAPTPRQLADAIQAVVDSE